jgi:hypothetical protein
MSRARTNSLDQYEQDVDEIIAACRGDGVMRSRL